MIDPAVARLGVERHFAGSDRSLLSFQAALEFLEGHLSTFAPKIPTDGCSAEGIPSDGLTEALYHFFVEKGVKNTKGLTIAEVLKFVAAASRRHDLKENAP